MKSCYVLRAVVRLRTLELGAVGSISSGSGKIQALLGLNSFGGKFAAFLIVVKLHMLQTAARSQVPDAVTLAPLVISAAFPILVLRGLTCSKTLPLAGSTCHVAREFLHAVHS